MRISLSACSGPALRFSGTPLFLFLDATHRGLGRTLSSPRKKTMQVMFGRLSL